MLFRSAASGVEAASALILARGGIRGMGILAKPERRLAALGSVLATGDSKRRGKRDNMVVSLPLGICFGTSLVVFSFLFSFISITSTMCQREYNLMHKIILSY